MKPVLRENLTSRVYNDLRQALMEGSFAPGHRFKIRALAIDLGVSETPVREALMQLVRERALEMHAAKSIAVARMTLAQYLELRDIRLLLEGMAAEAAARLITDDDISMLEKVHEDLVAAEAEGRWTDAVRANWQFHHTLYENSQMPELLALLESIWLRNGPLLNIHYPDAPPTYSGRHQHLNVLEALRRREPAKVREAIKTDMIEGGRLLVRKLAQIEGVTPPA
jgi:DNA-binding GntR family transcriptional regulator